MKCSVPFSGLDPTKFLAMELIKHFNGNDICNGTMHIRQQCRNMTVLSWHTCLIDTGAEKMSYI